MYIIRSEIRSEIKHSKLAFTINADLISSEYCDICLQDGQCAYLCKNIPLYRSVPTETMPGIATWKNVMNFSIDLILSNCINYRNTSNLPVSIRQLSRDYEILKASLELEGYSHINTYIFFKNVSIAIFFYNKALFIQDRLKDFKASYKPIYECTN